MPAMLLLAGIMMLLGAVSVKFINAKFEQTSKEKFNDINKSENRVFFALFYKKLLEMCIKQRNDVLVIKVVEISPSLIRL